MQQAGATEITRRRKQAQFTQKEALYEAAMLGVTFLPRRRADFSGLNKRLVRIWCQQEWLPYPGKQVKPGKAVYCERGCVNSHKSCDNVMVIACLPCLAARGPSSFARPLPPASVSHNPPRARPVYVQSAEWASL